MQIETILEKLAEQNYSGNVIIELFGSNAAMKKLLQSISWLKVHINN
jgi:sugar phosphate isomerase/epimerase